MACLLAVAAGVHLVVGVMHRLKALQVTGSSPARVGHFFLSDGFFLSLFCFQNKIKKA